MDSKEEVIVYESVQHERIKTVDYKFKQKDVGSANLHMCKKKDVEKENYSIVGFLNKRPKDTYDCCKYLNADGVQLYVSVERSKFKSIAGYVYIGDNKYVAIEGKCWLLLILLVLLFLLLLFCIRGCHNNKEDKEIANTTDLPQVEANESSGSIEFAGYSSVVVDSSKPAIYLYNPESNDVYFTYTVYEDDTDTVLLEETGLIEPGKAYEWKAGEQLSKGVHNVHFVVNTYSMSDCSVTYTPAVINNIQIDNH